MATQKDVKNRIASIKNINKITRAMEMVAAARLRRAEQRIEQFGDDFGYDLDEEGQPLTEESGIQADEGRRREEAEPAQA